MQSPPHTHNKKSPTDDFPSGTLHIILKSQFSLQNKLLKQF